MRPGTCNEEKKSICVIDCVASSHIFADFVFRIIPVVVVVFVVASFRGDIFSRSVSFHEVLVPLDAYVNLC